MEDPIIVKTILVTITSGAIALSISERLRFPAIILYFAAGILLGPTFSASCIPIRWERA